MMILIIIEEDYTNRLIHYDAIKKLAKKILTCHKMEKIFIRLINVMNLQLVAKLFQK